MGSTVLAFSFTGGSIPSGCGTLINLSLSSIGTQIGKRDHSTVIHAYKTIEKKMENDVELKQIISKIEQKIK